MTDPHVSFPRSIQEDALKRQRGGCASCGAKIYELGRAGAEQHRFGEGVEAHHVIPHILGGPITLENCVIICRSCHLNAHQGGRFGNVSIYDDLKNLPMPGQIARIAALYRHYRG